LANVSFYMLRIWSRKKIFWQTQIILPNCKKTICLFTLCHKECSCLSCFFFAECICDHSAKVYNKTCTACLPLLLLAYTDNFCSFSRAIIFISHGITEHSGRFHKLATFLQEHQFSVHAHDHGMALYNATLYRIEIV